MVLEELKRTQSVRRRYETPGAQQFYGTLRTAEQEPPCVVYRDTDGDACFWVHGRQRSQEHI